MYTKSAMYHLTVLIPAKFLILIAHFTICATLLWNSEQSVSSCLGEIYAQEVFNRQHIQLIVGFSLAIGMICFELAVFVTGVTMFHPTSALLSVFSHSSATILLGLFILHNWQCAWYWWIFNLSVFPVLYDMYTVAYIFIYGKY